MTWQARLRALTQSKQVNLPGDGSYAVTNDEAFIGSLDAMAIHLFAATPNHAQCIHLQFFI